MICMNPLYVSTNTLMFTGLHNVYTVCISPDATSWVQFASRYSLKYLQTCDNDRRTIMQNERASRHSSIEELETQHFLTQKSSLAPPSASAPGGTRSLRIILYVILHATRLCKKFQGTKILDVWQLPLCFLGARYTQLVHNTAFQHTAAQTAGARAAIEHRLIEVSYEPTTVRSYEESAYISPCRELSEIPDSQCNLNL